MYRLLSFKSVWGKWTRFLVFTGGALGRSEMVQKVMICYFCKMSDLETVIFGISKSEILDFQIPKSWILNLPKNAGLRSDWKKFSTVRS